MSERRIEFSLSPDDAFERVQSAANKIGKVKNISTTTRSLRIIVASGLHRKLNMGPELNVSILTGPGGDSSIVEIAGADSIDLYGHQRRAADTLVDALGAEPPVP